MAEQWILAVPFGVAMCCRVFKGFWVLLLHLLCTAYLLSRLHRAWFIYKQCIADSPANMRAVHTSSITVTCMRS